jgi:hypothetical protein
LEVAWANCWVRIQKTIERVSSNSSLPPSAAEVEGSEVSFESEGALEEPERTLLCKNLG